MRVLVLTLALFAVFSGLSCRKNEKAVKEQQGGAQTGGMAADFVLKDVNGKNTALSDYRGRVVLLEFWATWCPPCKATIPELVELQKRYGQRQFSVLAVSLDEGADLPRTLTRYAEEFHVNYPVLIGTEEVERTYGVISIPKSFLIDRQGKIVASYMGYIDNFASVLSLRIEELL